MPIQEFLDQYPAGPVVHALMMRYPQSARTLASLAGSMVAMGGGVSAQVTTGAAQGVGVVAALCGLAGMALPLFFKDRSERRSLDAEKMRLAQMVADQQKLVADQQQRLAELEKQTPQVEANTKGLEEVRLRTEKLFGVLKSKKWLGDPELPDVPIRVLVVEDDVPTARALVRLLGDEGFQVDYASSVAKSVDMLSGLTPYDWMTLDLLIDDGRGEDVMEFARKHKISTRIAVTTGTQDGSRLEALSLYAPERVFIKPVRWSDLVATLRSDGTQWGSGYTPSPA